LGLFIKNPNRYPHYEDPSKLRELVAYTSIKSSDGSHITIPIQVLADGSRFYNFSEINKISTKKVVLKDTLSEQGVVGLPVYYIADSSEITINRLPQPDAFMDRPEVLKQLCEMKESEMGGIFVGPDFQKYIKYDKAFSSKDVESMQALKFESPLIDAIETVLIDN
jgi:hypothetical protein